MGLDIHDGGPECFHDVEFSEPARICGVKDFDCGARTLEESQIVVQLRSVRFLFRFKSDEASSIAADALASPAPRIREEAAYALARRAYAGARPRLELLVNDSNPQTRANVMSALGRIGSPESLPLLLEALRDPHPWVRTNAVVAIGRLAAKDRHVIERPEMARDAVVAWIPAVSRSW